MAENWCVVWIIIGFGGVKFSTTFQPKLDDKKEDEGKEDEKKEEGKECKKTGEETDR